jgi:AraC family transcriptional regulator
LHDNSNTVFTLQWFNFATNIFMELQKDILAFSQLQPVNPQQNLLLQEKEQTIPGSVQYTIKRFRKLPQTNIADTGVMVYHFKKDEPAENHLELKFCISGNTYCRSKNTECDSCKFHQSVNCDERIDTVDLVSFKFTPAHLSQFVKGIKQTTFSEEILNFKHTSSFSKSMPLCSKTKMVLEALLNHSYTDSLENIYINAQTQMLLLYSMECMIGSTENTFTSKFLANEADREKIAKAREILLKDRQSKRDLIAAYKRTLNHKGFKPQGGH